MPQPTELRCPVRTCHRPGGCKARSSGCPASCPANDPTVAGPACLRHCQPGLAQLLPIHRVFSALLMTTLPAAQGTTLRREGQQLTTEPAVPAAARPRITAAQHTTSSGPDAVVSSASQGHEGHCRSWSAGSLDTTPLTCGKTGHSAGPIRPCHTASPSGARGPGCPARVPSWAHASASTGLP